MANEDLETVTDSVTITKKEYDDILKGAERWRALIGCARIRALGSAGITSDTSTYGEPYGNKCHLGIELWTVHECQSEPIAIEWLTFFADKAVIVKNGDNHG